MKKKSATCQKEVGKPPSASRVSFHRVLQRIFSNFPSLAFYHSFWFGLISLPTFESIGQPRLVQATSELPLPHQPVRFALRALTMMIIKNCEWEAHSLSSHNFDACELVFNQGQVNSNQHFNKMWSSLQTITMGMACANIWRSCSPGKCSVFSGSGYHSLHHTGRSVRSLEHQDELFWRTHKLELLHNTLSQYMMKRKYLSQWVTSLNLSTPPSTQSSSQFSPTPPGLLGCNHHLFFPQFKSIRKCNHFMTILWF